MHMITIKHYFKLNIALALTTGLGHAVRYLAISRKKVLHTCPGNDIPHIRSCEIVVTRIDNTEPQLSQDINGLAVCIFKHHLSHSPRARVSILSTPLIFNMYFYTAIALAALPFLVGAVPAQNSQRDTLSISLSKRSRVHKAGGVINAERLEANIHQTMSFV